MKKTMKLAAACAVLASPAMASNIENPLYNPGQGDIFTKIAGGIMYKKANDNLAMQAKDHAGAIEFPIWRGHLDAGYGINDRLSVYGNVIYTHDGDIDRKGMSHGRLGLNYRVFDGFQSPFVWDIYSEAHLGGISKMKAELDVAANPAIMPMVFNYDNYSNGRWGATLGTTVGKTWDNFTVAVFGEVLRTFGNDNNRIGISNDARTLVQGLVTMNLIGAGLPPANAAALAGLYEAGMPASFSVDTKSTWEYAAGINTFYEINHKWGVGAGFNYRHRAENVVSGAEINNSNAAAIEAASGGLVTSDAITEGVIEGAGFLGGLQDALDEFVLTVAVSRKLTDSIQVAAYGEYTFDHSGPKSQGGTDVKWELGARLNLQF